MDRHETFRRPRGRPKTMPDGERIRLVLDAARRICMARGFDDWTVDDLCAACNLSKRTLYQILPGKTYVLKALLDEVPGHVLAYPEGSDGRDFPTTLKSVFRLNGHQQHADHWWLVRVAVGQARYSAQLDILLGDNAYDVVRHHLSTWLADELAHRSVGEVDPFVMTDLLMNTAFPVVRWPHLPLSDVAPTSEGVRYLNQCLEVIARGVTPAEGAER